MRAKFFTRPQACPSGVSAGQTCLCIEDGKGKIYACGRMRNCVSDLPSLHAHKSTDIELTVGFLDLFVIGF